jgi:hypothetical protein
MGNVSDPQYGLLQDVDDVDTTNMNPAHATLGDSHGMGFDSAYRPYAEAFYVLVLVGGASRWALVSDGDITMA